MQDARLEQLFERFRRHGDVPALGAVFDETAGELLGVAMGLVREPGEADDLLQETFLTAIERAGRYESGRRLVPWLLGILVHHARERRRLARRALDATRLERAGPERPEERLVADELEQEIERALGALSPQEQRVLDAYLKHGKGAVEIALELGGSPGAVRMQIHRGLERLRKALPAGLALGAAGGALSAQGLDGVRAAVLRAGQTAAETLALGAGSAAGGLGTKLGTAGVLVGKKSLVAAVLAALCALVFLWRGSEGREEAARAGASERAGTAQPPVADAGALAEPAGNSVRTARRSTLEAHAGADPVALSALEGGLRGRLVERDGRPVAGLGVSLLEIEEEAILGSVGAEVGVPRLFVGSATSGADGVFALAGARTTGALQALGIDLGGARPSVRVVDVALEPGVWVELGDVVLAPTRALRGRVVDGAGAPLAGVRVRAGVLTEQLESFGVHELMEGGAVGELRSRDSHDRGVGLTNEELEVRFFLDVPAWLGRLEERLPFVQTRSDAQGEFLLPSAPASALSVILDRPGRMAVRAAKVPEGAGEVDLGTLVLDAGRTLAGRVVDGAGAPVAGAEVRGGRTGDAGPTLFAALACTDAEGRFRLTGISREGRATVVARRDASSAWTPWLGEGEALELVLSGERELLVEVVDATGQPVAEPTFELRPGSQATELGPFSGGPRPVEARAAGGARWSLGPRNLGAYLLTARAPGFAVQSAPCVLERAAQDPVRLVLERVRRAEVVVSTASGQPLAGALVTVEFEETRRGHLAAGRTDEQGLVRLELPAPRAEQGGAGRLRVRAEHPLHAPRTQALAGFEQPTRVTLGQGGTVVARLAAEELERGRLMLALEYRGAPPHMELRFPQLSAFDAEGVSRRTRLPAGSWRWKVTEALSTGEALSWLGEAPPRALASGGFELAEGQTLELLVGVPPAPVAAGSGRGVVHGRVSVNGAEPEGVLAYLTPLTAGNDAEPREVRVEHGEFRFEGVPAGGYYLALTRQVVSGGEIAFQQLATQHFSLAEGEERAIELEVRTQEVRVRVRDEGGAPVAGAEVSLWQHGGQSGGGFGRTDRSGEARLVLNGEGQFQLSATHTEHGTATRELVLDGTRDEEVELVLERGVPCAGRLRLAAGFPSPTKPVWLSVRHADALTATASKYVEFQGREASFELVGIRPGRQLVSALVNDQWLPEVELDVPEWGSTTLELELGGPRPVPR